MDERNTHIWARVLLGSAASMLAISAASAQTAIVTDQNAATRDNTTQDTATGSDSTSPSDIIVTGSRIDRAGYEAPTPVTVVTTADLAPTQRNNIGAALDDLPAFRATLSPTVQATGTSSSTTPVDLRGLGPEKTLVLLDGHRFIGDTDLNTVPFALVSRVDVVTGGASAAWGSGAVSGVVNIILNDHLDGGQASAQYGTSTFGDGREFRASGAYGFKFAGDRGHLMIAGEYVDNHGIFTRNARSYAARWAVFANPDYAPGNGQHQFTVVPNVNSSNINFGGVITTGVLKGQTFNPDGSLRAFQYGSVVSGTVEQGGEGPSNSDFSPLSPPVTRYNLSAAGNYEISDNVTAYGSVLFSRVENSYGFYPEADRGNITISQDNAFLSNTIRQQMADAEETSFQLGRDDLDFGLIHLAYRHDTISATAGLRGTFGKHWRWDAYFSHGVINSDTTLSNLRITQNYAQAIDSVISPTTGLPVCRVTLTDPSSGCVPINLFGYQSPSQSALNYVLGAETEHDKQLLDVGGASIRGEPFSLPAGEVSVAFGVEGRRESLQARVSPLAASNSFTLINFGAKDGSFKVAEAFGEVVVPLIKNGPLTKSLEFNGGYRLSHYSNSGSIPSWKIGLTDRIVDGFRLRGVLSKDIRSANLLELFDTPDPDFSSIYDPQKNTFVTVPTIGGGNPRLKPERATTYTLGGVLSPSWLGGFNLAVDYYNINIKDVITSIAGQDIVNRCEAGNTNLCSYVVRDSSGNLIEILSGNVNLARYKTDGIDIDASYVLPLSHLSNGLAGSLRFKVLATRVLSLTIDDGETKVNYLGNLGSFGMPKWKGLASITYQSNDLTLGVRARYVGAGVYDRNRDISNNAISAHTEFDLNAEYKLPLSDKTPISVFASVRNVFNSYPPNGASAISYDLIGRYITVGAKTRF